MKSTDKGAYLAARLGLQFVMAEAVSMSQSKPEEVVYVMAVPCPGCHRHHAGLVVAWGSDLKAIEVKPRRVVARVMNGNIVSVIERMGRH
jgi:hypothetical protein